MQSSDDRFGDDHNHSSVNNLVPQAAIHAFKIERPLAGCQLNWSMQYTR
jgi:hypothetical protein